MKNELEHIKRKYFSRENNKIFYANLDKDAENFCITFDKLLNEMFTSDHPDFYAKNGNEVYIFEHFTIDASHTNRKGSLEKIEINRIQTRMDEHYSKSNKGHISDRIDSKTSFENFKSNLMTTYKKHILSIPGYIETLCEKRVIDEDSKIITCFFIENTSPMGNYLLMKDKLREFNLFTADFFIDLIGNTEEYPQYIFYAQETKYDPILFLMSTKSLDIYKKQRTHITKENFIAFNPFVMQKRFFIEDNSESN